MGKYARLPGVAFLRTVPASFRSAEFSAGRRCVRETLLKIMEEKTVWKGSSSPVINFGLYAVCGLVAAGAVAGGILAAPLVFALLIVPALVALWQWVQNKCRVFEVTTERIKITTGVLTKRTEELELYRVKDTALVQPFLYRVFGAGNVVLNTTDVSTPVVTLAAIENAGALREELRKNIEQCRERKRVRITELE